MRHVLSLLVENESGALARVVGLFAARSFNIQSLAVAPTEDCSISRMTLVTSGSVQVIEQIIKQLNKLVDVIKIVDLSEMRCIERELMLIKVGTTSANRAETKRLVEIFRGRIIDVTESCYIIEMTGIGEKLDAFIDALESGMILEVVRSGVSGIPRGDAAI
ncbi:MAG: acetolactate synthase small subunit [Candidatus Eutrophobiaceae bacterium]